MQACFEDLACAIKLMLPYVMFINLVTHVENLSAGKCRFKRSSSPTNGIVYVQCVKTARIWGRLVLDIKSCTKMLKYIASFAMFTFVS